MTTAGKLYLILLLVIITTIVSAQTQDVSAIGTVQSPAKSLENSVKPHPFDGKAQAGVGTMQSQGLGFDMKVATTTANMWTWWLYSPYYDTGTYFGGCNVYSQFVVDGQPNPDPCGTNQISQPRPKTANYNLNSNWITILSEQGWGVMPLWVGPQAANADGTACVYESQNNPYWLMLNDGSTSGTIEADAAIARAHALGVSSGIIFYDMEPYNSATCSAEVVNFLSEWTNELQINGFKAGVYGGVGAGQSNVTDFKNVSPLPDAIWLAYWDGSSWQTASLSNIEQFIEPFWSNAATQQYCSDGTKTPCSVGNPPGDQWPPKTGLTLAINGDVENTQVLTYGPNRELPATTLLSPGSGATGQLLTPQFTWSPEQGAIQYSIAIATSISVLPSTYQQMSCPSCTYFATTANTSVGLPSGILQSGTTYYWEIQADSGVYKGGNWTQPNSFTTGGMASQIQSIVINPTTFGSGSYATVTIMLNGLAPSGGVSVQLQSTNSTAFPLPGSSTVPAGQSTRSLVVQAGSVGSSTTVTVTAIYNGSQTTTVTVLPSNVTTTTNAATKVTGSSAVLNGTVNPQGANGYYGFEWGIDPTLTNNPNLSCYSLLYYPPYSCSTWTPNSQPQSESFTLTGLPNSTTYYFRFIGWDSDNGTYQYGSILSFTTGVPPLVATAKANVSGSTVTLNGSVNPQGANGYYGFEWGIDPTLTNNPNLSCYSLLYYPPYSCSTWTTNSKPQSESFKLTGLPNSTTYYFRFIGWDSDNGSYQYGAILSFTTGPPPVVKTTKKASVNSSTVTITGSVNPLGANGYYGFEWGTDPTLTNNPSVSCYSLLYYPPYSCSTWTTNSRPQSESFTLTGLPNSTTYYFRFIGWDSDNGSYWYGPTSTFTTGPPPVVTTTKAAVTGTTVTLNGTVNPLGADGYYGFEWGTDPTLSNNPSVSCYSLLYYPPYSCSTWTTNSKPQSESFKLTGLPNSTTYYFRFIGWDSDNGSYQYGAILSFTTGPPPIVTTINAIVNGTTATLNGTVNPLGANGYYGFEWGTDPTLTNNSSVSCYSLLSYPPYSCPMWTPNSQTQSESYVLTGLPDSTTYYFRFISWDADNGSYQYGAILSFTTQ